VPDPDIIGEYIEFAVPDGKHPGDLVLVPRKLANREDFREKAKRGSAGDSVTVLVPPRMKAGMQCRVPDPDILGDYLEFVVPEGKNAGDLILLPRKK
jgi:hypothetical protein